MVVDSGTWKIARVFFFVCYWYHVRYKISVFVRKLSDNGTRMKAHWLLRQLIVNITKWLETWSCRYGFTWPKLGVTFTSSFIDNGGKGGWIPICTNGYSASPNSPRRAERASRGCHDRGLGLQGNYLSRNSRTYIFSNFWWLCCIRYSHCNWIILAKIVKSPLI